MVIDLLVGTLIQGFLYAFIAYGVFITYKILDFPDLTVDGSFPLGAAVTALLLSRGVAPFATLPVVLFFGALAGLVTGLIHVKLGVRNLLAGIITMTALFSINLQIAGSNLIVDRSVETIFTSPQTLALMGGLSLSMRKLVVTFLLALLGKLLLDAYFKSKSGLLLRAVGDNSVLVTTLAVDKGKMTILGLVISNALVALSGALVCHEQRAFSSTMGTGQVVFGLATVIIGSSLFDKLGFVKGTTAVLVGSILYKGVIQVAISLGLPANLLKLVTAVLFLAILVYGNRKRVKEASRA